MSMKRLYNIRCMLETALVSVLLYNILGQLVNYDIIIVTFKVLCARPDYFAPISIE